MRFILNSPRAVRPLAIAACASLVFVVAACGSDDTTSTASTASKSDGLAAAEKVVQSATQIPEKIAITTPVSGEIPSGKKIAYVSCGVPSCDTMGEIATSAGAALGWTVTVIHATSAPEDVQKAMQQVVRDKYDGLLYAGFSKEAFRRELEQLKSANIPVVAVSTEDSVGDGIVAVIRTAEEGKLSGSTGASYVIAKSKGKANIGVINLPAFKTIQLLTDSFVETVGQQCPDCTVEVEDLPNSVFTTGDASTRMVSFLRKNPEIDYLFLSNDGIAVGLPAALKAAGLAGKVKFGGSVAGVPNLQMIKEGQQAFTVPTPIEDIVWQQTDAMARALAGDDPKVSMVPAPVIVWDKDNLPSDIATFPAVVPNVEALYLALWGK